MSHSEGCEGHMQQERFEFLSLLPQLCKIVTSLLETKVQDELNTSSGMMTM